MQPIERSRLVVVPVVIDTNILVPSLYRRTNLFKFVLSGELALVWNHFTYQEAKEIIERLASTYVKHGIDSSEVLNLLDSILDPADKVSDMPDNWKPRSPDRDDDPFLYAALTGGAKYIISADIRHMLKLGSVEGIPIGRPRDFFPWVKENHPIETYTALIKPS